MCCILYIHDTYIYITLVKAVGSWWGFGKIFTGHRPSRKSTRNHRFKAPLKIFSLKAIVNSKGISSLFPSVSGQFMVSYKLAYLETHISHLKMDGWETILSLWGKRPSFRGELLLPGSVHPWCTISLDLYLICHEYIPEALLVDSCSTMEVYDVTDLVTPPPFLFV